MYFLLIVALAIVTFVTAIIGNGNNEIAAACAVIFFPSAIALYLSPTIVAGFLRHPRIAPIFMLNLLTGWTFIGWVGALIWAYSTPSVLAPQGVISSAGPESRGLKTCPYCAEQIRSEAIRCKHCGSDLVTSEPAKGVSPNAGHAASTDDGLPPLAALNEDGHTSRPFSLPS